MCIPTSVPVAQWLEHCVSSAKVVGSIPREHTYWNKCICWIHCKSLWIKASAKCINVNDSFNLHQWQTMVHCKTQTAPSGQRGCLQGEKVLYKQAKYTLEKEIRVAKRIYSEKLRIQFSSSNSASVWKGMKDITSLQYTILQHCRESTTGRRSEWVLLQIWKKNTPPPWTPLHTTINTSTNPPLPYNSDQRRQGVPGLPEAEKEKFNQAQILCWQAGPHLHKDLQQITVTVRSPFMLQMLHHHPHPKETQNYRSKWLQACGSNVCGHEGIWKTGAGPPEGHHWTLAGSSSVCLPSKQVCGRCHGTALCSATSRLTRGLCEDPVCGLQLGL